MSVYVTGDTHGGFDLEKILETSWPEGQALSRSDYLIICGDFGFPWNYSREVWDDITLIEDQPWTTLFVDGNHERYDYWAARPIELWHGGRTQRLTPGSPIRRLMRGEVFDFSGDTFFTMGGATSVDRDRRVENVSWWPEELPSEEEFEHARQSLDSCNWEVDYVITHDCSARLLPKVLYPSPEWQHPDVDRLNVFLDELEERLSFRRWYFGHHHRDMDVDERHAVLYDRIVKVGQGVF